MKDALCVVGEGKNHRLDTGQANKIPFFNVIGMGLDAEIGRRFNRMWNRAIRNACIEGNATEPLCRELCRTESAIGSLNRDLKSLFSPFRSPPQSRIDKARDKDNRAAKAAVEVTFRIRSKTLSPCHSRIRRMERDHGPIRLRVLRGLPGIRR